MVTRTLAIFSHTVAVSLGVHMVQKANKSSAISRIMRIITSWGITRKLEPQRSRFKMARPMKSQKSILLE